MSRKLLIPLILAGALVAVPTLAEEIVYFTNGTSMAIESHEIDGTNVRVNLGGQGFLAFPLEQIDKIETAEGEVPLPRPSANQIVNRPRATAGVVRGTEPSRLRRGQWRTPTREPDRDPTSVDRNGMAVYRPFGKDAPPNKQGIGLTGRRELRSRAPARGATATDMTGTTRVGERYVLPPKGTDSGKIEPVGVILSGRSSKKKKEEKK
jgi:hypothetical protein